MHIQIAFGLAVIGLCVAGVVLVIVIISAVFSSIFGDVGEANQRRESERRKSAERAAKQREHDAALKEWQAFHPAYMEHAHATVRWKTEVARLEATQKRLDIERETRQQERARAFDDYRYKVTIEGGPRGEAELLAMFNDAHPNLPEIKHTPALPLPKHPVCSRSNPLYPYNHDWGPFNQWKVVDGVPQPLGYPKFD